MLGVISGALKHPDSGKSVDDCRTSPGDSSNISLVPQDKAGPVTTALPIETFRASLPIPDLLGPEDPKNLPKYFWVCQRDIALVGLTPDKLKKGRIIESLLNS
jgi:hypothetical protein